MENETTTYTGTKGLDELANLSSGITQSVSEDSNDFEGKLIRVGGMIFPVDDIRFVVGSVTGHEVSKGIFGWLSVPKFEYNYSITYVFEDGYQLKASPADLDTYRALMEQVSSYLERAGRLEILRDEVDEDDTSEYEDLLLEYAPKAIETKEENEHYIAIVKKLASQGEGNISDAENDLIKLLTVLIAAFEETDYKVS